MKIEKNYLENYFILGEGKLSTELLSIWNQKKNIKPVNSGTILYRYYLLSIILIILFIKIYLNKSVNGSRELERKMRYIKKKEEESQETNKENKLNYLFIFIHPSIQLVAHSLRFCPPAVKIYLNLHTVKNKSSMLKLKIKIE